MIFRRLMARVLPLVYADVGRLFLQVTTASDAMGANEVEGGGYGLVARPASEGLLRTIWEEEWPRSERSQLWTATGRA